MDADSLARIREIVSESVAEVKRHNGVLIEDLRHKLDLVLEGQQGITRNVEDVRGQSMSVNRTKREPNAAVLPATAATG